MASGGRPAHRTQHSLALAGLTAVARPPVRPHRRVPALPPKHGQPGFACASRCSLPARSQDEGGAVGFTAAGHASSSPDQPVSRVHRDAAYEVMLG